MAVASAHRAATAQKRRILVVDDETSMRELLDIVLSNEGYQVSTATDPAKAKALLEKESFDAILTDLRMGTDREAGMNLLSWVEESAPGTPAIMMTAYGSVETAIEAMKRGAADYIMKPFKNDEIRLVVKRAIEKRDLLRENVALRRDQAKRGSLNNLIGQSAPIEEVRNMVRRVATLPSTVSIRGESGTGKELVARGIHQLSDRASKPFVAINCGGVPENLLESELFGYKKGAFTGANEDKEGLFVVAHGGTLFLDEIGEMPIALQVKLLRVLDDGVILPVGGTKGVQVDVRLISATNRNLEEMVKEGTFREDLFYRLNVIPVQVPALRERSSDIPVLARHFIAAHSTKMGRPTLELSPEAEAALRAFRWPGNVRELENVLERAVALCAGTRIETTDLPVYVRNFISEPSETVTDLPSGGVDLERLIGDIEVKLIKQALQNSRYSQKRAAELLGLTPRSLRYRLKKYGFETD
jgi:two-component system response regulator PilR (NtrC family)